MSLTLSLSTRSPKTYHRKKDEVCARYVIDAVSAMTGGALRACRDAPARGAWMRRVPGAPACADCAPDHDSAWCSCRGKHPAPLCPDGRSVSAPRQPAAMNAPVTVKSSGVSVMSAPLTTCAVMLAMRPVAPSSPNAAPRTCEREGGRRVEGGRREGRVETPSRPMRAYAPRRAPTSRSSPWRGSRASPSQPRSPCARGARAR